MGRIFSEICLFLIVTFLSGCVISDDSKETEYKGTYTLEAQPTTIQNYCGGGGIFILKMEPGENFDGYIHLTLKADPNLNAKLIIDTLTISERIAEIEIYPNMEMSVGTHTLTVISENLGVLDELELEVVINKSEPVFFNPPDSRFIEFTQWVESKYTHIVFKDEEEWFSFFKYPILDGSSIWVFFNSTFEITIKWPVVPLYSTFYLLRKRGEVTPILAAKKEVDGEFFEISIEEWKDMRI